jgi:hypothetical protein
VDNRILARGSGVPIGAGVYFVHAPWWVIAVCALGPLVLPEMRDVCRWLATRPQASLLGTYLAYRIVRYPRAVAREMANRHAFEESELHELGAAPPPPESRTSEAELKQVAPIEAAEDAIPTQPAPSAVDAVDATDPDRPPGPAPGKQRLVSPPPEDAVLANET